MQITVNGKPVVLDRSISLSDFVAERNIKGMFAIEKNLKIIIKEG